MSLEPLRESSTLSNRDDSSFGARRLATLTRMPVASPAYLAARHAEDAGRPRRADCIFGPGNFGRTSWSFRSGDSEISVDLQGRICTNSGPGMFASALAGLGIAMMSTVMAGDELKQGRLVPLLRAYKLPSIDVHAVFPGGPRPSAKVRALVDYLAAEL